MAFSQLTSFSPKKKKLIHCLLRIHISIVYIFDLIFRIRENKTKSYNSEFNQKRESFKNKKVMKTGLVLFMIFSLGYFGEMNMTPQHISKINNIEKYCKKEKKTPIMFQLSNILKICGVSFECESENITQGRSYVNKNISISDCYFSRASQYDGRGGIIYVNDGDFSMYINYSMFYNCVCSDYGGAIFFYSSKSCLRMICANSCSCGSYKNGHSVYLLGSQENHVEYLSVSNCTQTTSGYYSILLGSGDQIIDNTNSSMNNAIQGSGIHIISPSSITSSHCTFSNNKVSEWICILFRTSDKTISISYANIVHNNSPSWFGVVYVEGEGSINMMYCIFQNNQDSLFCVKSGSLEVSHSFIDHYGSFSTSTAVSTNINNSFTSIITYQIQFFNSLHCNTDIPLPQRTTYESTMDQTII